METPPKEAVLFENIILNIQKFISSLEKEISLSDENKFFLIEEMTTYAIVMMSLFLKNTHNYEQLDEYDKLHSGIIERYKKFIWENCGVDNKNDKEYYWNTNKDSILKKSTWIGFCESKGKVDKEKMVSTIVMDSSLIKFSIPTNDGTFKQCVTQLVNGIEISAKNFSYKIP